MTRQPCTCDHPGAPEGDHHLYYRAVRKDGTGPGGPLRLGQPAYLERLGLPVRFRCCCGWSTAATLDWLMDYSTAIAHGERQPEDLIELLAQESPWS